MMRTMMKKKSIGAESESEVPKLARKSAKPIGSALRVGTAEADACAASAKNAAAAWSLQEGGAKPGDKIVMMVRDPDGSMRALGPDDAGFEELFARVNARMGGGFERFEGEDLDGVEVKAVLEGRPHGVVEAMRDDGQRAEIVAEMEKALGLGDGAISQRKLRGR